LDFRARAIAAMLQVRIVPGERVLVLLPPGLDYVAAFFGCLYAGAIAVPAFPPRPGRSNHNQERLDAIAKDCSPAVALAGDDDVRHQLTGVPVCSVRWSDDHDALEQHANQWKRPATGTDSAAFLQYTSGSTRSPRGVMVSHANLLHNQALIRDAF